MGYFKDQEIENEDLYIEYMKKYTSVLQKEANKYIREARRKIKEGTANPYLERALLKANNRMRLFQKQHGQHKAYLFSQKGLTDAEELETYEQLLDSVIENVRLNTHLSEKHKESQIQFYQDQKWASNRESAEALYEFKNSTIFEELMDMNLSDIPSEIMERYAKFVDADYDVNDFSNMITVFNKQLTLGNKKYKDVKDFYKFTDRYMKLMKEREFDFNKGVSDFIQYKGDRYKDFFSFMKQF